MNYARTRFSDIETVIPYGNPPRSLHLRFVDDYKTFCGRTCDDWPKIDKSFTETIDSPYCCTRCKTAAFK